MSYDKFIHYEILYTKHLTQKTKKWLEGTLDMNGSSMYLRSVDKALVQQF